MTRNLSIVITFIFLTGCASQVSVPTVSVTGDSLPGSGEQTLQALKPRLASNGTESIKIPDPKKITLPKKGDDFIYGQTVTEALQNFYQAVYAGRREEALDLLKKAEAGETDNLMLYSLALMRVRILIPMGKMEEVEEALEILGQREKTVFGKDLETTALRGEMHLWRGNLEEAESNYSKVLRVIGHWRVPTFYMSPPSNNNEIIYFGRAQLTAAVGLTGVLILKGDYESALAWAVDAEKHFKDVLGLTEHMVYGRYTKATPDLYTNHGWSLVFLAGARIGYSKNLKASEPLLEKAKEYFAIENHLDGRQMAGAVREYVSLKQGLAEKPTFEIGLLPDLTPASSKSPAVVRPSSIQMASLPAVSLPEVPISFLRLPKSGEESVYGFKVIPEFEQAFQDYLKGEGEEGLARLDQVKPETLSPSAAWSLSYLRTQILIMMGRSADAEIEAENSARWEKEAFGTNLNARSLRGDARTLLGDYEGAVRDFAQVIEALGDWRLPTSYVFPPADVSQLAHRSRAQLRAYVGTAAAHRFRGDYEPALHWAQEAEKLFEDLDKVIEHPISQNYVSLDVDMVYGRGMNLGILGSAYLALTKNVEASQAIFDASKKYFDAVQYSVGQVIVDAFRIQALVDIEEIDLAEALARQVVSTAIDKGLSEIVWRTEALLGEALLKDNRPEEAEQAFRRAQAAVADVSGSLLTDRSKRRFGVGKEDITRRLAERDIEKGRWDDLFRDLERGRATAFVDMLGQQQVAKGREEQAVSEIREIDRKIRRQRLVNVSPKGANPTGIKAEKDLLRLRRDKLEALRKRDPEIAEALSIFVRELGEIQRSLEAGEVIVYALPTQAEEKLRFFVIHPHKAQMDTSPLTPETLRSALKSLRSLHLDGTSEGQNSIVSQLAGDLQISNWEAKKALYVVPSGDLHFVPWGAFEMDYPAVVLPTGGWLKRPLKPVSLAKTACVVGDPETGGIFPPLPGAREEAAIVGQLYGVNAIVGEKATEEALRRDTEGGVGVLHLATHGFFDVKNPLDSAVILTTGSGPHKLTARKLFENPLPANLVVLSGCETGMGQAVAGDDFLGLARSFYLGGTQAVVHSLWPVHDLPTRQFMEEFHKQAGAGDYGTAWLKARNRLKEKNYPPSVYGAFILGGQKEKVQ